MKGLLAVALVVGGLYGIGFLSAVEATDNLTKQLENKSFAEANLLLSANFQAKK